jgi:hypothetical protein
MQYGIRKQSELYFSNDTFCRVDDPICILTDFKIEDDSTPCHDPQEGDVVTLQNVWGHYFGYLSTRPSLVSAPIAETKFVVKSDPNGNGLKFIGDYSTVTMCGKSSDQDVFKVFDNEAEPGYKNMLCTQSNEFIGAAPTGQVMLWTNSQLYSTLWKITKV